MINDLDETIKKMLVDGVPLDTSEIDVVFEAPNTEWKSSLARPTINCYLYHVAENKELRRNDWEVNTPIMPRGGNGGNGGNGANGYHQALRKRVPFRIDLSYMVTAWANEIEDEHRLLWRVLSAFIRYDQIPEKFVQGDMLNLEWPMPIRVIQPNPVFKNPSDFWSSMEVPVKPSVDVTFTLPLDPDLVNDVPLVLTKRILLQTIGSSESTEFPAQIGGWVFGGRLEGEKSGNGAPVVGAEVLIVEKGVGTVTDEDGRFKFTDIPHGRYTLRANTPGGQAERVVEVPGDEYDLVMTERAERNESNRDQGDDKPRDAQERKTRRR